ncbi:M23 family metallopeptidase [Leucobacter chromiiresistens]|uniref:M23 family metallopeptidase n=1 Tax=Leucobacter chromiiresistens TaxID=1079994 RepID=UPI000734B612|nr:M23 family metallopeptidase [Leucobacter chromiiresistens]
MGALRRFAFACYRARIVYIVACIALRPLLGWALPDPLGAVAARAAIAAPPLLLIGYLLVVLGPRFIPRRAPVTVTSPVTGRWRALNSPASRVPSHGVRIFGQSHAIDLVAEPADPEQGVRPEFGSGAAMRPNADYPAFGAPVRAMLSGTVVRASDWRRDHRARSTRAALAYLMIEGELRLLGGPGPVVGNHVVIRDANGVCALVAHLQRGSVVVDVGDTVRAGEMIGRCGNSGNSSEPHVHAQLMDRASPAFAIGVPMRFAGVLLDEAEEPADLLPKNDHRMTVPVRRA